MFVSDYPHTFWFLLVPSPTNRQQTDRQQIQSVGRLLSVVSQSVVSHPWRAGAPRPERRKVDSWRRRRTSIAPAKAQYTKAKP